MTALIRGELVKAHTTKLWWGLAIALFVLWLPALGFALLQASLYLTMGSVPGEIRTLAVGNLYTAGQYFGLLFTTLFATLLVTNEYQHRTASATYLAAPDRTRVVFAKITIGVAAGALVWVATTLLDLAAGTGYLAFEGLDPRLDHPEVIRLIGSSLAAHLLWAVLGVGIGALLRNQVGALITVTVLYVLSGFAGNVLLILLVMSGETWLFGWAALFPGYASQLLTQASPLNQVLPGQLPWWAGGLILTAYAMLAAALGAWATARRDIS